MIVTKGSFLKIDYNVKITESNRVFDTTDEELAKKEGIFIDTGTKVYEPTLLVLGFNWFPVVVEERLIGKKVGNDVQIDVSYKEAYGPRDPAKIRLVARREFQKLQINPQKGERVNLGTQNGLVLSVTPGRVRVDFNHELSGKDLTYNIKILDVLNTEVQKIQSIINRRLPGADILDSKIGIEDSNINIELPKRVLYFEYIQFAKRNIVADIKEIIGTFELVTFVEHFDFDDITE